MSGFSAWDAVERVTDRLRRAVDALAGAGVPYTVVGGHAVAAWVELADKGGVRNTPDVNLLVRRADFDTADAALTAVGFVHRLPYLPELFLDGPDARPRDAVLLLYAGERVRPDDASASPDVSESICFPSGRQVLALEPLVRMKLTAHRRKDRVHIRDMIDVGLIDANWPARFPPPLGERLQALLDDPDG